MIGCMSRRHTIVGVSGAVRECALALVAVRAVGTICGRDINCAFVVTSDAQLDAYHCENKEDEKQPAHKCWNKEKMCE